MNEFEVTFGYWFNNEEIMKLAIKLVEEFDILSISISFDSLYTIKGTLAPNQNVKFLEWFCRGYSSKVNNNGT